MITITSTKFSLIGCLEYVTVIALRDKNDEPRRPSHACHDQEMICLRIQITAKVLPLVEVLISMCQSPRAMAFRVRSLSHDRRFCFFYGSTPQDTNMASLSLNTP